MIVRVSSFIARLLGGFHYPGGVLPTRERGRLPTLDEVILTIRLTPDEAEQCWIRLRNGRVEKTPELWIAKLGVWVYVDGRGYSGDIGRGVYHCGWFERRRLRRACRQWDRRNEK